MIYYPFQEIHSDPGQIPRFPYDLTGQIEKLPQTSIINCREKTSSFSPKLPTGQRIVASVTGEKTLSLQKSIPNKMGADNVLMGLDH